MLQHHTRGHQDVGQIDSQKDQRSDAMQDQGPNTVPPVNLEWQTNALLFPLLACGFILRWIFLTKFVCNDKRCKDNFLCDLFVSLLLPFCQLNVFFRGVNKLSPVWTP